MYVVDDDSGLYFKSKLPQTQMYPLIILCKPRPIREQFFLVAIVNWDDLDKDGDLDFGIAGADVDIPPCQINGIRQFTMDQK